MVILILLKVRLTLFPFFQLTSRRSHWRSCGLQLKMFESQTLIHKNKTSEQWTRWWTKSARLFFEGRGLWSPTFHDPRLCNVQYIQPDLKYFYPGLWNSIEQKKWNQCHMKCVGNNTKYITEYNWSVQFSTKVITIRIDFNLYFESYVIYAYRYIFMKVWYIAPRD